MKTPVTVIVLALGLAMPLASAQAAAGPDAKNTGPNPEYRRAVVVDPALPEYTPRPIPAAQSGGHVLPGGAIQILGNDGDEKLMELWTKAFAAHHPHIRFKLNLQGSSTGIAGLYTGVSLFAPMGREIWPVEVTPYEKMLGHKPFEVRVSRGSYDVE
jgi:ABC-type phosphate transport system substrate-binding protein